MSTNVSIYLDLVRFLAALLVLVGHLAGQRLTGGLGWFASPFLDDAVTVFFVLSGFVIAHVTSTRERDWRSYAASRALRILPVALAALVLTATLDTAGRAIRPELYSAAWGFDPAWWHYPVSALFMHQVWTLNVAPGSNLPYWSLGFEVWYYAAFGVALFVRRGWLLSSLVMLAAGPRIALLYPLWLCGVACHRLSVAGLARRMVSTAAFPAALLALAAAEAYGLVHGWPVVVSDAVDWVPAGLVRSYVVGLLFCATILGLAVAPPWTSRLAAAVSRPVRWLAGATFSIYLFHLPVAQVLAAVNPWPPVSAPGRILVLGGTLAATLLLAGLVERRKREISRWCAGIKA